MLIAVILGAIYLFAKGPIGTSFPIAGVILVVLVLGYSFLANRTIIGRHIYRVGGNWRAAALSGVRTRRVDCFGLSDRSRLAALPAAGATSGRSSFVTLRLTSSA